MNAQTPKLELDEARRGRRRRYAAAAVLMSVLAGGALAGCSSGDGETSQADAPDAAISSGIDAGVHASTALPPVIERLDRGILKVTSEGSVRFFKPVCDGADPTRSACHSFVEVDATGADVTYTQPGNGMTPADLQAAYDIPTYLGTKATIAILGYADSPNFEADMTSYRSTYGLPPCTSASGCFRKVNNTGAASPLAAIPTPTLPDGGPANWDDWAIEETLDIEMASTGCPTCNIILVEMGDLPTATATAARLGASVASHSGGGGEFAGQTTYDSQFAATGIGLFASSGDNGWSPTGQVEWPAASTAFTAVGGTVLTKAPTTFRGWTESAWGAAPANPGDKSAAGWGCSLYEPKPSWQKDSLCAKRTVADVSAVASGVSVLYTKPGKTGPLWYNVGGTSVASPLVASIYALTGISKVGPGYSYTGQPGGAAAGSFFRDVTTGVSGPCGNYLCTAVSGYDGPTGNGVPNSYYIAEYGPLKSPNPEVNLVTPSEATLLQGNSVTVMLSQAEWTYQTYLPPVVSNLPPGTTSSSSCSVATNGTSIQTVNCAITLHASPGASIGTWTVPIAITISGNTLEQNLELDVTACTPATSCTGAVCGTQSNGCGGSISCGSCVAGDPCINGACCAPQTTCSAGQCGASVPNGCGGTLSCGGCASGATCYESTCCTPATACRSGQCGAASDGCGGTLSCGGCAAGLTCGGGGIANVCGKPLTCRAGTSDCGGYCCKCTGTTCM